MVEHLRQADLVEFEVGNDRFAAQGITAECAAAGRRVELLTMDSAGQTPGGLALQPHRIIAEAGDAEAVHDIIRCWIPEDSSEALPASSHQRRTLLVWTAAALLLALVILGLVASLLDRF